MRQRLLQFMQGRYGTDQLSKALMILGIFFLILNLLLGDGFYFLALVTLGICYFRVFSRNYAARSAENQKYLRYMQKIRKLFSAQNLEQMKHYHIYKCPSCGQKIRIPRGKGKIQITCPKCRCKFEKKS